MKFKIALCQMKGSINKKDSMKIAGENIKKASENGAEIISLPEMWNCPYSNDYFREYAETEQGETVKFLSNLAKETGKYIIGGSIPELDNEKVYNTAFIFNREGKIIGKHRKAHLFDIDVKGGIRFMESDTLSPGEETTVVETEFGKIGVAICYDIRFPEFLRKMTLEGAKLIIIPAAFNMTTGPAHWELSARMRALDNQVYFAINSPARQEDGVYVAYGHSMIVNPWGEIISTTEEKEDIVYGEIDIDYLEGIREQLPLLKHRREEIY